MNLPERGRIGALDSDLQLDQSRTHPGQKRQLLLVQQIRPDLKMEISDAVVMIQNIGPHCHGVGSAAVEGTVHKLHLGYLPVKEELQLSLHHRQTPESHRLVN